MRFHGEKILENRKTDKVINKEKDLNDVKYLLIFSHHDNSSVYNIWLCEIDSTSKECSSNGIWYYADTEKFSYELRKIRMSYEKYFRQENWYSISEEDFLMIEKIYDYKSFMKICDCLKEMDNINKL